jgi:uncharacterized protein
MNPGGPLVILYADDLGETQRRLEDAGARIVKPVFAFPGGRRLRSAGFSTTTSSP